MAGSKKVRRLSLTVAFASALAAFLAPGALAARPCANFGDVEKPFAAWGDPFSYALVQHGDFEAPRLNGWRLAGGAAVVEGNEPFRVHGANDHRSLSLPVGSSVTTPSLCVSWLEPTLRLFATSQAHAGARLKIEVMQSGLLAAILGKEIADVDSMVSWGPTKIIPLIANFTEALIGDGRFSLRFTAVRGDWLVDDVYIDPLKVG